MKNHEQLLISLKDTRAETFAPPFVHANASTAIRLFQNAFKDEKASEEQFVKTPEDFELHVIATIDLHNGEITPRIEDTLIIKLTDLQEQIKPITN